MSFVQSYPSFVSTPPRKVRGKTTMHWAGNEFPAAAGMSLMRHAGDPSEARDFTIASNPPKGLPVRAAFGFPDEQGCCTLFASPPASGLGLPFQSVAASPHERLRRLRFPLPEDEA